MISSKESFNFGVPWVSLTVLLNIMVTYLMIIDSLEPVVNQVDPSQGVPLERTRYFGDILQFYGTTQLAGHRDRDHLWIEFG